MTIDELPVCVEMDSDNWEDTFFTELAQSESPAPNSPVEEDEEDLDIERTPIYVSHIVKPSSGWMTSNCSLKPRGSVKRPVLLV